MKINPEQKINSNENNDSNPETIWKLSTVVWHSFFIVALVSIFIFIASKRSIYDELEYIIFVVAIILFVFLTYGLFIVHD